MKLNGIRLLVKDFDESFRFYSEKLGLKVIWGEIGGVYASFDVGSGEGIAIFPSDIMAEAVGNKEQDLPANSREKIAIVLEVDDVDKKYEELSAKGVEFVNKPTDMTGWGMRTVHLRDTEGNLIELYTALPTDKWDEDLQEDMKKFEK
ncbi:VOC family protein [Prevotella sp. 10(H)]|uniref:VOC family protein n=1 Tax=Prevotella sp. 10(H) TaxID=1158294 RepID=UPI0004A700D7|nr:VOC family protein [Prevotella sp. 10(H)]